MRKEILLSYFSKMTTKRYQAILKAFSSLDHFFTAEFEEIHNLLRWEEGLIHEFLLWRDTIHEKKIEETLARESIQCILMDDPLYPSLLKDIYDPPICLFVRGTLTAYEYPLAVVGTRKHTSYGKQVTQEIVTHLAQKGVVIISGLALGIDAIAHETTLVSRGTTVAVLGAGVDRQHVYPSTNKHLAERIVDAGGALVSEYPPETLPTRYTFPKRNRIIAGMSLGTLVIEAPESSGALITAECSLEAGRDVFAVPQNITSPTSVGPNNLLKTGAVPVLKAGDILDALNLTDIERYVANKHILPESPAEEHLLKHLTREPIHIDELIRKSGLSSQAAGSALTIMEMQGKVKNLGAMMYVIGR
jgi:DNA processing protein